MLAALAQGTRAYISGLLVRSGFDGISAGNIGKRLDLPATMLSFHLNHLKHAGLVRFRREGRSLLYVAAYTRMNALLAYLMEDCCPGIPQAL